MNIRLHKTIKILAVELNLTHYDINNILYNELKRLKENKQKVKE